MAERMKALVYEYSGRVPGQIAPWVQPGSTNPYKVENPFTGEGDRVTHNGRLWLCTSGDGAGNNVWEPGTQNSGWTDQGAA